MTAMMRTKIAACLIVTTMVVAPAGGAAATPSDLQQRLDAVHAAGMPGAIAIVQDGRRRQQLATGVADVTTLAPAEPGMRHRIGSITKTFVATTVLQLVAEHKIGLDAPVRRYLPGLEPPAGVTVRMLLNHTSGIGDYDTEVIKKNEDVFTVGRTTYRPEQLARIGLAATPTNAPGAQWSYSNTNYVLAALIVQKVTGRPYEQVVTDRILRPLHLRDTYFEGTEPVIRGPHMHAYVPWTDGTLKDLDRYNMSFFWGDGEMVSTGADLNRFFAALLTGHLLTPAMLTQMKTTVPAPGIPPTAFGYGLGIYFSALPCGTFWGHDGLVFGSGTLSLSSPDGKTQLTYEANMSHYAATPDNPIDNAANTFALAALCGSKTASLQAAVLRSPR
jgi:D-alanyl-D-alanine carboxypeptidase